MRYEKGNCPHLDLKSVPFPLKSRYKISYRIKIPILCIQTMTHFMHTNTRGLSTCRFFARWDLFLREFRMWTKTMLSVFMINFLATTLSRHNQISATIGDSSRNAMSLRTSEDQESCHSITVHWLLKMHYATGTTTFGVKVKSIIAGPIQEMVFLFA